MESTNSMEIRVKRLETSLPFRFEAAAIRPMIKLCCFLVPAASGRQQLHNRKLLRHSHVPGCSNIILYFYYRYIVILRNWHK